MKTVIVDYDAGNVKSLQFALERLGVKALITNDSEHISAADKVIFPGQGEAGSAMDKLKSKGLDLLIPQLNQAVLGICLGMQLLCEKTEEGNTEGLGIIPTEVKRFPKTVKVPQMGWNTVNHNENGLFKGISQDCYMYLVHSYSVPLTENTIAQSDYAGAYSVAVEKDNFYGVQFHPEKSSKDGLLLLENFLKL
ncbi:MAG: imidazole glycerol phosphate synthase subunit HisH [Flavobacteriaceae bacterium]|jgi:glutamine amidotransferase|nr:imidazole glycerol phosphate synthase subunit HisH [Flavobacteriaceae bacterium]|tara:strand:+ start:443 stop:1024 length:582 start_codon:yes stop_codon:yes gene_type:complete